MTDTTTDAQGVRPHAGIPLEHPDAETAHATERAVFGFWIFLMSDLVVFALLLATYAVLLRGNTGAPGPAEVIELAYAFPETLLLLTSTLTLTFASVALREDRARGVYGWTFLSLALGAGFLALEGAEIAGLIGKGHIPQVNGFLSGYWLAIGTHGLHVAIGVVWGLILIAQFWIYGFCPAIRSRLVRFSLYWHMLDVVWIAIFTVIYLPGSLVS
ncbi:cytochrome c oxidase subunit 3 [Roseicyclus sp. F158]|uniref:Cytochrome c oxidase subunit 3 n=1 Tax=Tropicimonas omnivorans TaxID=3075590 RepID=A0ABU3DKF2_9RHOB|nr:cytochrome c oxidase subunit 3 [Roseicyclus sp. F158]MDT0683592.1 cytochrome c oxidase subunit 3 [Roseicyclus sp. F158]